jgi:hypothetical protein
MQGARHLQRSQTSTKAAEPDDEIVQYQEYDQSHNQEPYSKQVQTKMTEHPMHKKPNSQATTRHFYNDQASDNTPQVSVAESNIKK